MHTAKETVVLSRVQPQDSPLINVSLFREHTYKLSTQRYNSCYLYVLRADFLSTKKTRKKRTREYLQFFFQKLPGQTVGGSNGALHTDAVCKFCRIKCNGIHSQYLHYLFFARACSSLFAIEVWPLVSYSKRYNCP